MAEEPSSNDAVTESGLEDMLDRPFCHWVNVNVTDLAGNKAEMLTSISISVANKPLSPWRVTLILSDSAALGVAALSSPVLRSKKGKVEDNPSATAALST